MIQVRVVGVSALREVIGKETSITLKSGSTVNDLIHRLEEEFGPAYKAKFGEPLDESLKRHFSMLLNGSIFIPLEKNLDKPLSDDDRIVFFQWSGA